VPYSFPLFPAVLFTFICLLSSSFPHALCFSLLLLLALLPLFLRFSLFLIPLCIILRSSLFPLCSILLCYDSRWHNSSVYITFSEGTFFGPVTDLGELSLSVISKPISLPWKHLTSIQKSLSLLFLSSSWPCSSTLTEILRINLHCTQAELFLCVSVRTQRSLMDEQNVAS